LLPSPIFAVTPAKAGAQLSSSPQPKGKLDPGLRRDDGIVGSVGKVESASLHRGDLIFWKGHVGIMRDATTLLHANGHHMMTVTEPLADAITRIKKKGGGDVTSVRRL
jgi:cell wall-associated NlpC family hydrolase